MTTKAFVCWSGPRSRRLAELVCDWLRSVFGSEIEGMPQRILEKHPERCFTIPMPGAIRSLNLATAVGIVLYEALRVTRTGHDRTQRPRAKARRGGFDR